ncbi:MAG TPA: hypothetical protein VFN11_00405 [Ktedonobacterales bacterium]|nr:hypothetical protein [Ktedonobacterales bacterium]
MSQGPSKRRFSNLSQFWQRKSKSSQWPTFDESAAQRLAGQPARWDPVVPGGSQSRRSGRWLRAFQQRFRGASRRQRMGVAAGAGGLLLAALLGIALLCSHLPAIGSSAVGANGSATSTANASATANATTTTTPLPFTLAFTCASGAVKQSAKVCVHTQPGASLNLTVRYCDGSYAGGRNLHGSVTADKGGNFTWIFAVHTRCAGSATATVAATSAGKTVTKSTKFTITG